MLKSIYRVLVIFAAIFFCLACGKVVNHWLGGLPPSLYGLLLFALLINANIFQLQASGAVVGKIIYYMPLVFLPVCIGVMEYFDLFQDIGVKVVFIGVTTTLLGLIFTAWVGQVTLSRAKQGGNESDV